MKNIVPKMKNIVSIKRCDEKYSIFVANQKVITLAIVPWPLIDTFL